MLCWWKINIWTFKGINIPVAERNPFCFCTVLCNWGVTIQDNTHTQRPFRIIFYNCADLQPFFGRSTSTLLSHSRTRLSDFSALMLFSRSPPLKIWNLGNLVQLNFKSNWKTHWKKILTTLHGLWVQRSRLLNSKMSFSSSLSESVWSSRRRLFRHSRPESFSPG